MKQRCDFLCDSFKTKGNLTKHTKSKAHYKKCVELGVVPVPTTICDDSTDKDAMVQSSAASSGNAEESSEEEEESDGEESEESGSEEQEAAQSLLSLSQRNDRNRLPGLLPSGRPTTYPYALTLPILPTTSATVNVTSTATSTSAMSGPNVTNQGTTLIQSELSHRYYFSSNRATPEESRSSVIQSASKRDDSDVEMEETSSHENSGIAELRHQAMSQPIDLTTKQPAQPLPSPIPQRARPADILTPVSEPVLLQTLVQTMERLPIQQGREWKPDAQSRMLQVYLTERHVMDSKIKQQYRVGNGKLDKQTQERDIYPRHQDPARHRHMESNGVPTVTYTDPSKIQHAVMESRVKHTGKHTSDEIKMEIREKIYHNNMTMERRAFDLEIAHKDKELPSRSLPERESFELVLASPVAGTARPSIEYGHMSKNNNSMDRPIYSVDAPILSTPNIVDCQSPKSSNMDANNRVPLVQHTGIDVDRDSMFNAIKMMSEMERPRECHPVSQEVRAPMSNDVRMQNQSPRNLDLRPPSREIRTPVQEYRTPSQELRLLGQEQQLKMRGQEMKPTSCEFKPFAHEMQVIQEIMPSTNMELRQTSSDNRPPSRDMRALSEYRAQPQDLRSSYEIMQSPMHEPPKSQNVDARGVVPVVYHYESKHTAEATKQNAPDNTKHAIARKIVVGGPDFRSPSPNTANPKPQAEFLQPSSGPAPNYVT